MSTHNARTVLNQNPEIRQWVELWLKDKERSLSPEMNDDEFDKHWRYVRPERVHEGAVEGVAAYYCAHKNDAH